MSNITANPKSKTDLPISEVFNIFTKHSAEAGMKVKGLSKARNAAKEFIRGVAQEIWTEVIEKGKEEIPNFCFDVDLAFVDAWRELVEYVPYRAWTYKDPVLHVISGMKDTALFGRYPHVFELLPDDYNYQPGDVLPESFAKLIAPPKPAKKQAKPLQNFEATFEYNQYGRVDIKATLAKRLEKKKAAEAALQAITTSSATIPLSTAVTTADEEDGSAPEQDDAEEPDGDAAKKDTTLQDPIKADVAQKSDGNATAKDATKQEIPKVDSAETSNREVTKKDATPQNSTKTDVVQQEPIEIVAEIPTTHVQYHQHKAIIKNLATTGITASITTTEQDFWTRAMYNLFPFMFPHESAARLVALRNLEVTSKNPNPWKEKWHSFACVQNTLNCRLHPGKWGPLLREASEDWEMYVDAEAKKKAMKSTVFNSNPYFPSTKTPVTALTPKPIPKAKTKAASPFPLAAPKKNPLAHHTSVLQQPLSQSEAASKNIFASLVAKVDDSSDGDDDDDTPLTPLAASTKTKMSGLYSGKSKKSEFNFTSKTLPKFEPSRPATEETLIRSSLESWAAGASGAADKQTALSVGALGKTSAPFSFKKAPTPVPFGSSNTPQVTGPSPFMFRTADASQTSNPFSFGLPAPVTKPDDCIVDAGEKAFAEKKSSQPVLDDEQKPSSPIKDAVKETTEEPTEEPTEDEATVEIEIPTAPTPEPSQLLPDEAQKSSSLIEETAVEKAPIENEVPTTPIQESSQPVPDIEQKAYISEEEPVAKMDTCTAPTQEPIQLPPDAEQQLSSPVKQAAIEKASVEIEIPTTPVQKPSQPAPDAEQIISSLIKEATIEESPVEIKLSSPVKEATVEPAIDKATEQVEAPTAPLQELSLPVPEVEQKPSSSASKDDVNDSSDDTSNDTGTISPKQEPNLQPDGRIEDHLFELFRRIAENEATNAKKSDTAVKEDMVVPVEEETIVEIKEAIASIEEDTLVAIEEEMVAAPEEKAIVPAEETTTTSVEEEATKKTAAPVEEKQFAPVKDETVSPAKEEIISSAKKDTVSSAKDTVPSVQDTVSPAKEDTVSPADESIKQPLTTHEKTSAYITARPPVTIPIEVTNDTPLEVELTVQSTDSTKEPVHSTDSTKEPIQSTDSTKTPRLSFNFEPLEDLEGWAKDTFGVEFAADRHVLQLDETPFRELFDSGFLDTSILDAPFDAIGVGDTESAKGLSLLQQLEHTSISEILFEELTGIKVPKEVVAPEIENKVPVSRGLVITSVSAAPLEPMANVAPAKKASSISEQLDKMNRQLEISCIEPSAVWAPLSSADEAFAPTATDIYQPNYFTQFASILGTIPVSVPSKFSEQLDKMDRQLEESCAAPSPVWTAISSIDEDSAPTATDIYHPNHFTEFASILGTVPVAAPFKSRPVIRLPRPTPSVRLPCAASATPRSAVSSIPA